MKLQNIVFIIILASQTLLADCTFPFQIEYYSEIPELTKEDKELIYSLVKDNGWNSKKKDAELILDIANVIVDRIKYDDDKDGTKLEELLYIYDSGRWGQHVSDTWNTGKGVCIDYSILFYEICNRLKITNIFYVAEDHTWNSVQIAWLEDAIIYGYTLYVDVTAYAKDKNSTFIRKNIPFSGYPYTPVKRKY